MIDKNQCITVMANRRYLHYFPNFYQQLRVRGQYSGEINLITDSYIHMSNFKKSKYENVNILKFKNIKFSQKTLKKLDAIENGRNLSKPFQWRKFYLFDPIFREWKFNLYIDINMKINKDITPILNLKKESKLIAPYDAYPDLDWSLETQFNGDKETMEELRKDYDLNTRKYFQTGIIFYDTSIIKKDTISSLIKLVEKYPVSKNNEQGIMNLHFLYDRNLFFPLDKDVYSYWSKNNSNAVITKK